MRHGDMRRCRCRALCLASQQIQPVHYQSSSNCLSSGRHDLSSWQGLAIDSALGMQAAPGCRWVAKPAPRMALREYQLEEW